MLLLSCFPRCTDPWTPGAFLSLNFHHGVPVAFLFDLGSPPHNLFFFSFQSPSLTCPTLPHVGSPAFLPGPSSQESMPSACSVLPQWPAACPTDKIRVSLAALLLLVQLGSPGVTSGRCPIKLCAMSNVCNVALLKTLGLGGFQDVSFCPSAHGSGKQGRACWWQQD